MEHFNSYFLVLKNETKITEDCIHLIRFIEPEPSYGNDIMAWFRVPSYNFKLYYQASVSLEDKIFNIYVHDLFNYIDCKTITLDDKDVYEPKTILCISGPVKKNK